MSVRRGREGEDEGGRREEVREGGNEEWRD